MTVNELIEKLTEMRDNMGLGETRVEVEYVSSYDFGYQAREPVKTAYYHEGIIPILSCVIIDV